MAHAPRRPKGAPVAEPPLATEDRMSRGRGSRKAAPRKKRGQTDKPGVIIVERGMTLDLGTGEVERG